MKVALYLRVSTARQAEKDLSIPDQRNQLERWCKERGWSVVAEYVEPGASATDDKRPQFQRMIEDASRRDRPFDAVVVHSFSRFFRDSFKFEMHRRTLERNNVALVSLTQTVSEDPSGQMFRQLCAMFDEYQSKENAKHVLRAMKENARLGFWNGGPPPFGYKTVVVETRADAVKRRLQIDEEEAAVVRKVFDAYRAGQGIRNVAYELNREGLSYRRKGKKFTQGVVHQILSREAYAGTYYFNRVEAKRKRTKDKAEWIAFETPVIIQPDVFSAVQRLLQSRRPVRIPPRVVNGPTLLTGLAECATCGGGMTIRTGKSGRYRYYTCATRINEGVTSCTGRNISMQVLDDLVLDNLEKKVFDPERLTRLLQALADRARTRNMDPTRKLEELRSKLAISETRIERMYAAVAEGTVHDTDLFRRSLVNLEADREDLVRQIAMADRPTLIGGNRFEPDQIAKFATAARQRLRDPDPRFRKAFLRQFVARVEVGDSEIRILGPEAALLEPMPIGTSENLTSVPSLPKEWRALLGSNQRPAA